MPCYALLSPLKVFINEEQHKKATLPSIQPLRKTVKIHSGESAPQLSINKKKVFRFQVKNSVKNTLVHNAVLVHIPTNCHLYAVTEKGASN